MSVLEPIPSLSSDQEKPILPKVSPADSKGSIVQMDLHGKSTQPAPFVRKIDSPFEHLNAPLVEPHEPKNHEPANTVPANPLPTGPLKKTDAVSQATAMKRPNTAIPAAPPSPSKRKKSLTGPVEVRSEPRALAPPDIMLRNTIRRSVSEQNSAASPFRDISPLLRMQWMIQALFSSRTFDDIAFEKTRRFRIEEVYLLRKESYTLISYASSDPIRHIYPRKVDYDLRRLRVEVNEAVKNNLSTFKITGGKNVIIRTGNYSHLVAVIRGTENEFFEDDLDYTHRRIEHRVGKRLIDEVSNFTFPLQPLLEDCLLIQSPTAPQ